MKKIAVVGASGYSGAELLKILLKHPGVEITCVTSRQEAGVPLSAVFPRFKSIPAAEALHFVEPEVEAIVNSGAELAFLALPHGIAWQFAGPLLEAGLKVIDLSDDFRVKDPEVYKAFRDVEHPAPQWLPEAVYGLPEWRPEAIRDARLIASPGCYPTSMLIPLLPLVKARAIDPGSIVVSSMSGTSGAGKKASTALLFAECNESVRAYGAPNHRHLAEVEQELSLASGKTVTISFTPHLIPVTAGIATTIYATDNGANLAALYEEAYADCPFVRVLGENGFPDTKHVVGTNFIDIGWVKDPRTSRVVLFAAEDNLGKGAASQAVQSMNLIFGSPETDGLLNF